MDVVVRHHPVGGSSTGRVMSTQVDGKPGVRVLGPGADHAYVEAGLSRTFDQIDAEARRLASGH